MTPTMTELRAEWRRSIGSLSARIKQLESDVPATSADPDVAIALWILKLKRFREEIAELLAPIQGIERG